MLMAKVASLRSGCNSRSVGAVAVKDKRIIATGYVGTLPGEPQCTDQGPEYCFRRSIEGREQDKYNICPSIHAEANLIAQAARYGPSLSGTTIYCTLSPCYVCAKALIACGVAKVYYEMEYSSGDSKRDQMWLDFIKEKLNGEQFSLQYGTFIDELKGKSSFRKLNQV